MFSKIQHAAIVSENFVREAKFYEAIFGMKRSRPGSAEEEKAIRTNYAVSISDGYVGVTVIGRKPGYVPGLHHFGVDVDDVGEAIRRLKKNYPEVAVLKRPSNRPFATYGAHDPEGNYFDLTQEGMANRRDVYAVRQNSPQAVRPGSPQVGQQSEHPRRIHHLKLRVMNPANIAAFYRNSFDLKEADKALEDPNYYLTDGEVTLIIAPWKMSDYEGAGIDRPGLEHVGFKVEDIAAVKRDLAALREADSQMNERVIAEQSEGERRLALIKSCRHAGHVTSSPDGIFVDMCE
ncbi:MAG TPA: VOC family protein [Candidatus Binatia bacterium]|nr:VOC family protein [Candidatus Binatia bacterium]